MWMELTVQGAIGLGYTGVGLASTMHCTRYRRVMHVGLSMAARVPLRQTITVFVCVAKTHTGNASQRSEMCVWQAEACELTL